MRLCAASDVTVGITHGAWYTSWLRTVSAASGEEAACFFFVLPHRCAASSCVCVFFVFFCRYFCRASVQFGIADGLSGVPAARGEAFFPELLVS